MYYKIRIHYATTGHGFRYIKIQLLRPSSDAELHMSRIVCEWGRTKDFSHWHSIRLMLQTAINHKAWGRRRLPTHSSAPASFVDVLFFIFCLLKQTNVTDLISEKNKYGTAQCFGKKLASKIIKYYLMYWFKHMQKKWLPSGNLLPDGHLKEARFLTVVFIALLQTIVSLNTNVFAQHFLYVKFSV